MGCGSNRIFRSVRWTKIGSRSMGKQANSRWTGIVHWMWRSLTQEGRPHASVA